MPHVRAVKISELVTYRYGSLRRPIFVVAILEKSGRVE